MSFKCHLITWINVTLSFLFPSPRDTFFFFVFVLPVIVNLNECFSFFFFFFFFGALFITLFLLRMDQTFQLCFHILADIQYPVKAVVCLAAAGDYAKIKRKNQEKITRKINIFLPIHIRCTSYLPLNQAWQFIYLVIQSQYQHDSDYYDMNVYEYIYTVVVCVFFIRNNGEK